MSAHLDLSNDGHVHTRLCLHAQGEMEDYVQAAEANGLRSLTFLEHMELGLRCAQRSWLELDDFAYYIEEGLRLKDAYRGRVEVRLGVELGYNPKAAKEIITRLQLYPWDRIGLSCHFYPTANEDICLLSRRPQELEKFALVGVDEVLTWYFLTLLEAVETVPCHHICHLDAALRHLPGGYVFTSEHQQLMLRLLHRMANKGIALEINTSGYNLRQKPFPHETIIAQALALGIPLCVGSDAHQPQEVGQHFHLLPDLLMRLESLACSAPGAV